MSASVLLVDDERFARTVYSDYLRAAGYEVEVAPDAEAALGLLKQRRFDVLLTDVILPGSSGLDLLGIAKGLDPNLEVVVITALDKVDPAVRAMKSGEALVAVGTSCRHQVADLAGATGVHPAVLIRSLLEVV